MDAVHHSNVMTNSPILDWTQNSFLGTPTTSTHHRSICQMAIVCPQRTRNWFSLPDIKRLPHKRMGNNTTNWTPMNLTNVDIDDAYVIAQLRDKNMIHKIHAYMVTTIYAHHRLTSTNFTTLKIIYVGTNLPTNDLTYFMLISDGKITNPDITQWRTGCNMPHGAPLSLVPKSAAKQFFKHKKYWHVRGSHVYWHGGGIPTQKYTIEMTIHKRIAIIKRRISR